MQCFDLLTELLPIAIHELGILGLKMAEKREREKTEKQDQDERKGSRERQKRSAEKDTYP